MDKGAEDRIVILLGEIEDRVNRVRSLMGRKEEKMNYSDIENNRMGVLAEVSAMGGAVSKEEWKNIGAKYGFSARGLGGFYVGNGSMIVRDDGMRELSDRGKEAVKQYNKSLENKEEVKMKFHYTIDEWEAGKEEIRNILIEVARKKSVICYSALVAKLKTIRMDPHVGAIGAILGEISTEENKAGRGLLSVLVVRKTGDMKPGDGFFEMAKSLGRDVSDKERCWTSEVEKIYEVWGNK